MRLYFDSSAIIYLIEGRGATRQLIRARIAAAVSSFNGGICTSRISLLECRSKPMRLKNDPLLAAYDAILLNSPMAVFEIDASIVAVATKLQADHNLRTPDSIHMATAIHQGASAFLTGDKKLQRCGTLIPIEIIQP